MPGLALITLICSLSACAACAFVAWNRASECCQLAKRMRALEPQIADLRSEFEALLESHKKLRSRIGMRELRERRAGGETEKAETKAELRARLGLVGASGPAFTMKQLEIERAANRNNAREA